MSYLGAVRGIGITAVVSFLAVALTPAANFVGRRMAVLPDVKPAGAVVVLAAGLRYDGSLSDQSMRRFMRGVELYKRGLAPTLVLSGRSRLDRPRPTEAEIRGKFAELSGIPPAAILKEETANTTQEESARIFELLKQRNILQILLVTESLHMRRATYVFERAGFEVFAAPSDDLINAARSPNDRLQLAMRIAQETAALVYYRLAGYL